MSRSPSPASAISQHDKLMDFVSETMTTVDEVARKWSTAFTKITCEEDMHTVSNCRVHFNELLLQQMLALDNVEADDNELRNARKCVIHKIQAYIKMLELFAAENDTYPAKEEKPQTEECEAEEVAAGENSSMEWEVPEPMSEDEIQEPVEGVQQQEVSEEVPQEEDNVMTPVASPKPVFETPVVSATAPVESPEPEPEQDESSDEESESAQSAEPVVPAEPQPTQQQLFRMAQLEKLRQQQAKEEELRQRQAAIAAERERQQQRLLRQRKQQEAERRRYSPFFGFDDDESPFGYNTSRYPTSRNRSHTSYNHSPFFNSFF
eukprot:TRINITY_DN22437_c0_g1_i1.p1 TRINITY_DN22437_c0_g1~~TRINITY_DN22437_c0_g1_i1.p1  ORF type:complete len:321 (+),score=96.15 TRINITY_DN22437_c0_g1_i1:113-1075(+)